MNGENDVKLRFYQSSTCSGGCCCNWAIAVFSLAFRTFKTLPRGNKTLLLNGLSVADTYYNIAGWVLMLSGIVMFWLQDWHRVFQLWFILSVLVFIIDSLAEKRLRDPANKALATLQPGEPGWDENTSRLHNAVSTQMVCTLLIFFIMLLHSQLQINLLAFNLFSHSLG